VPRLPGLGLKHGEARALQRDAEKTPNGRFVVDDEDAGFVHGSVATGRLISMVVPSPPGPLVALTCPP